VLSSWTLNTFYEFKTASTYFTINSLSVGSGRQEYVHKVMLCTFKWLQEYYINPFYREQQANSLIAAILNGGISQHLLPALNLLSLELSLARQELGHAELLPPSSQLQLQLQRLLSLPTGYDQRGQELAHELLQHHRYPPGPAAIGSSIRTGNMIAFPEATQVRALTERDAIIPDVPLAVAELVNEECMESDVVEASATIID
jgi:hypothetical protein